MSRATVLVVEDDAALQEALCDTLSLAGFETLSADDGRMAMDLISNEQVDMVVSDVQMQRMGGHALLREIKSRNAALPVLLMTAHGTVQCAVEAMREGAVDYLIKPFDAEVLVNMVGQYVLPRNESSDFIAVSQVSKDLQKVAARVADSNATVLISGESGTGKEVLARYIHRESSRRDGPFIAINCAAIPENMLEATLFGYEKGAFTGAYKACVGKFELAQGGTLLLDEISEMDMGLQAKLLRVLQEREVERLGGNQLIPLDVRVLATSNQNMREEVVAGRFREDLFYRLNVFPLLLAPLRERREDIIPIAEQLLRRHAGVTGSAVRELDSKVQEKLIAYDWPGNVRELDNVLQRALILHNGSIIRQADLVFEEESVSCRPPIQVTTPSTKSHANSESMTAPVAATETIDDPETLGNDLKRREYIIIIEVLKDCMGNRSMTAEKLGISPRTLRYKIQRMREAGIELPA